ncbi:uncharacterized protein LOC112575356 isoform X2 [Pomacea canaliculata]|uniref:uncharacterized protein LOC112575356 isoform X2 n=1 Tax=Pomacea canaliculata TaxID=400727 RepID=UPI000D72879D|nr:uncharacterized protein LOC112575356 isoform X2 [Pomacea canaliculata]
MLPRLLSFHRGLGNRAPVAMNSIRMWSCLPVFLKVGRHRMWKPFTAEKSAVMLFSKYPVPERSSLPQDLQVVLAETEEKAGFLPNVFATLSHRPEELRLFLAFYNNLMAERPGSNLSKADKEMIIVATSAENRCLYCIIAHSALHRIYSKNKILADQLAANWRHAELDGRQRAILEFAIELCHCRSPTPAHHQALGKWGLTEEDSWDIGAIVALFALSNRYAFLAEMKPNAEFHLFGRIDQPKA